MLQYTTVISIVFMFLNKVIFCQPNNVCDTFEDYADIETNQKCWYDPDVGADISTVAANHGFRYESHEATTSDGFIITLFRIPNDTGRGKPTLLHHGMGGDSACWFYLGNESLPFMLSKSGFDVWLTNTRGTRFTRHTKYTENDREFWNFSFHESGFLDAPAVVEYIVAKTGMKVIYVGHSMGTTASFIYSSTHVEEAKKNLERLVCMSPSGIFGHTGASMRLIAPLARYLNMVERGTGIHGLGDNIKPVILAASRFCKGYPGIRFCSMIASAGEGGNDTNRFPAKYMPILMGQMYGGISFKCLKHYSQLIHAKTQFNYFDYGEFKNLIIYNSTNPPQYDVSKIEFPVHFFSGTEDSLTTPKDVAYLFSLFENSVNKTLIPVLPEAKIGFTHFTFLIGEKTYMFYEKLIGFLKQFD